MEILNVENLTMKFGSLAAVDGVSLSVGKGEIIGLIGPNGAGKTTFFNCLTVISLRKAERYNSTAIP